MLISLQNVRQRINIYSGESIIYLIALLNRILILIFSPQGNLLIGVSVVLEDILRNTRDGRSRANRETSV